MSTADNLIGLAAVVTTVTLLYKGCRAALSFKNGIPLPPGPPAWWFWDNALPSVNIARTLADWVSKYVPLVTLRQGRVDLISKGNRSLLLGSGEWLHRPRKAAPTRLQHETVKAYRDAQLENAKNVITDILSAPTQFSRDQMCRVQLETDEMAGNLFGVGSETSAVAITNMIMAAACYPEAQRRVQEELDMVVGRDKIPTWEDYKCLPQVRAYVLEALRWKPVTPTGFAGATELGCHLAIHSEPEKFDPQRWIDANGRLRNNVSPYPHGFGRGTCPGQVEHLTNESLCITLALLFWSFRIVEQPDAPIDMNSCMEPKVIAQAAPFDVEFIPRMEEGRLKALLSEKVTWMCHIA